MLDSLESNGDDYSFSFPIDLDIAGDELYIVDQKTNTINVFDPQTLSFSRKFGQPGIEPGIFNRPLSVSEDGWGNIAISDFNNDRLQFLSPYGDYIDEIELIYPWKTCYYDQQLYIDVLPGSDQAGIYSVADSNISLEVDLNKYFTNKHFGSVLDKYYSYCVMDWGYVLSFSGRDEITFFNNSGKPKRTKVDKLPLKYKNTLYGKPLPYQEGFLILASSNDHDEADSTQTEISYHNIIGQYDKKGNLLNVILLPDKVWLTDSWALYENQVFLYDTRELVVYKFSLN